MKTFILTLTCAFALIFTSNLSAQLSIGGRAGINLAKLEVEFGGASISTDSKTGLDIAAFLNIGMTENFSIQPELHYLQKGGKIDDGGGDESTIAINYLEIPVLAKYGFGTETIQGFVMAGPSLGFGLNGKAESCFNGTCETDDLDWDNDGIKRGDFSILFGAGVGFNVGPGQLFVDIRYGLGLANLDDTDDDATTKNKGFMIGAGYMVPLGN